MKIRSDRFDFTGLAWPMILAAVIAFSLIVAATAPAEAQVRRQCFQGRCVTPTAIRVSGQPQVVINPSVFPSLQPFQYQVGSQLREEALAELIAQKVVDKLRDRTGASGEPAEAPAADVKNADALAAAQGLVGVRCLNCHNPSKPDRLDFTDLSKLGKGQIAEMISRTYNGTMPPKPNGNPLSDEEVYVLLQYMVSQ